MSLVTVSAGPKFDEGTYEIAVFSLKPKTITEKASGQKSDVIEWQAHLFYTDDGTQVLDQETDEPIVASALSSKASGPRSKNVQWLVALLGPSAAEPGFQIEEDDPRVLKARALGEIIKDDGGYARINALTAKPRTRRTVAAAATEEATEEAPAAKPARRAPAPAAEGEDDDLPF